MRLITATTTLLFTTVLNFSAYAVTNVLDYTPPYEKKSECTHVVISGESNWPPYSYLKEGHLVGAGVDLARQLFQELDIPVVINPVEDYHKSQYLMNRGYVDFFVGTYVDPRYADSLSLVHPAYFSDHISVATTARGEFKFFEWEDLGGYIGRTTNSNQLGTEFADFARGSLYITPEGNIMASFSDLNNGLNDYVIGSAQMLKYGVNRNNQLNDFVVLHNIVKAEDVHLGFAMGSECKMYTAYMTGRLKTLKEDGTIQKLLQKHTSKS